MSDKLPLLTKQMWVSMDDADDVGTKIASEMFGMKPSQWVRFVMRKELVHLNLRQHPLAKFQKPAG